MQSKPAEAERTVGTERPRLVVADDDAFVRTMLQSQLASDFECVGKAADAMDAIALVDTHRPDVAILDVLMPGGGALFATHAIRVRSPETTIVILSGDETEASAVALLSAGATVYLRKDIDPSSLGRKLAIAMASHRRYATRPHGANRGGAWSV